VNSETKLEAGGGELRLRRGVGVGEGSGRGGVIAEQGIHTEGRAGRGQGRAEGQRARWGGGSEDRARSFGEKFRRKKGWQGNCRGGERGGKYQDGGRNTGGNTGGQPGGGGVQSREQSCSTGPCRHRVVWHRLHCDRHILGAENKEARVCTTRVTYSPGED